MKIKLPKILDERGNLTFVEARKHVPFDIARVHWVYNVPGGESRGGHSLLNTDELIIALSGSFSVRMKNNQLDSTFVLNRPYEGLIISAGTWRQMCDFSTNSIGLVLSSLPFDPAEYKYEA